MNQEETSKYYGYSNYYAEEESRKRSMPYDYGSSGVEAKRPAIGGAQPLLKLLVPNYAAGALLGQGGTLLNELKTKYNCNIRLSPNKENYPGTDERIVVTTGDIYQIICINNHIMDKVQDPGRPIDMKSIHEGRREIVKIVLTDATAYVLLGINGNTLRGIQEKSQANISICMPNQYVAGERVITVSGTMDQRMIACCDVIAIVAPDSSNMANTKIRYSNFGTSYTDTPTYSTYNTLSAYNNKKAAINRGQFSVMSALQDKLQEQNKDSAQIHDVSKPDQSDVSIPLEATSFSQPCRLKARVDIQIDVPNKLIGGILGPKGAIIRDIALRSGARLRFSDYVPKSPIRTLSITGDKDKTDDAYNLINQRVEQLGGAPLLDIESTDELVENASDTDSTIELPDEGQPKLPDEDQPKHPDKDKPNGVAST